MAQEKTIFLEESDKDMIQIAFKNNELAIIVDNFEGGACYFLSKKSALKIANAILEIYKKKLP